MSCFTFPGAPPTIVEWVHGGTVPSDRLRDELAVALNDVDHDATWVQVPAVVAPHLVDLLDSMRLIEIVGACGLFISEGQEIQRAIMDWAEQVRAAVPAGGAA